MPEFRDILDFWYHVVLNCFLSTKIDVQNIHILSMIAAEHFVKQRSFQSIFWGLSNSDKQENSGAEGHWGRFKFVIVLPRCRRCPACAPESARPMSSASCRVPCLSQGWARCEWNQHSRERGRCCGSAGTAWCIASTSRSSQLNPTNTGIPDLSENNPKTFRII